MGAASFPAVKRPGLADPPTPIFSAAVLKKGRAIPLPTLRTLVACYRENLYLYLTNTLKLQIQTSLEALKFWIDQHCSRDKVHFFFCVCWRTGLSTLSVLCHIDVSVNCDCLNATGLERLRPGLIKILFILVFAWRDRGKHQNTCSIHGTCLNSNTLLRKISPYRHLKLKLGVYDRSEEGIF